MPQAFTLQPSTFGGQTAVVVGGASGLGLATVRTLHGSGAYVIVLDRNGDHTEKTVAELNSTRPGSAAGIQVDVSDQQSVASAFAAVDEVGKGIDIVVNSAGIREIEGTLDLAPTQWDRVLGINLSGTSTVPNRQVAACARQATPGSSSISPRLRA